MIDARCKKWTQFKTYKKGNIEYLMVFIWSFPCFSRLDLNQSKNILIIWVPHKFLNFKNVLIICMDNQSSFESTQIRRVCGTDRVFERFEASYIHHLASILTNFSTRLSVDRQHLPNNNNWPLLFIGFSWPTDPQSANKGLWEIVSVKRSQSQRPSHNSLFQFVSITMHYHWHPLRMWNSKEGNARGYGLRLSINLFLVSTSNNIACNASYLSHSQSHSNSQSRSHLRLFVGCQ